MAAVASSMDSIIASRHRRASDEVSGLALKPADFPDYSNDDLMQHFKTFTAYDLDSSGFISPENLLDVLKALEVKGASIEMVRNIIEEVAILSGHDNDGKLSFRDYMHVIKYDHDAAAHNLALDAQTELNLSVREEEESMRESGRASVGDISDVIDGSQSPTTPIALAPAEEAVEAPAEEPPRRMRQSSMAAVAAVAAVRIKAFQQKASEAQSMRDKLAAFQMKPADLGPIVNSDKMHKETLRNKVKAFETAARFKGTVELKKTWRQVGDTRNYTPAKKLVVGGQPAGPPPKKKITDLP